VEEEELSPEICLLCSRLGGGEGWVGVRSLVDLCLVGD
jgi:hypothetical protein